MIYYKNNGREYRYSIRQYIDTVERRCLYLLGRPFRDANHDEATSNKVVVIIKQRNIASLDITVADQTYSGAAVKPDVTVRHGNIVLNESTIIPSADMTAT